MADSDPENFLQRTRAAKKVMVLDLGFLGDTVHLLPALWMVRQAYPQAELHVAVAAHITSLMDCAPWVNRVWGYMRYPRHATLRENWQMVSRLRREKFDVVINLNGSDRSSWLTFLSGARERLGRVPDDGGPLVLAADVHRARRMSASGGAGLSSTMPLPAKGRLPFHTAGISRRNRPLKICARRKLPKPTPERIFTSARSRPPITRNCRRSNSRNSSPRWEKVFLKKSWRCPARRRSASRKKWRSCSRCFRKSRGVFSPGI